MLHKGISRAVNSQTKDHAEAINRVSKARWLWLLTVGHPHVALAAPATVATQSPIFGGAIVAGGEFFQLLNGPYHKWAIAWSIRRRMPQEYYEANSRHFAVPGDVGRNYLVSPRLGFPRIKEDRIEFTIWPAVGRNLSHIEAIIESLGSQFRSVDRFEVQFKHKQSHKGKLIAYLKEDETGDIFGDEILERDIQKPVFK